MKTGPDEVAIKSGAQNHDTVNGHSQTLAMNDLMNAEGMGPRWRLRKWKKLANAVEELLVSGGVKHKLLTRGALKIRLDAMTQLSKLAGDYPKDKMQLDGNLEIEVVKFGQDDGENTE